jgi:GntR family transcriptional regulator
MADPMYRRIAEELLQQIESGELAPGRQLPTELELREQYGNVSRNTVRDAIKWLTNRGLITTQPGRGTFVVEKIDPFVTTLSASPATGLGGGEGASLLSEAASRQREAHSSEPRVEMQRADEAMAAELGMPEGSLVILRHQRRFVDNKPWSLQTTYYPKHFADEGAGRLIEATDIDEGTVPYLAQTLGIEQAGYRDTISIRRADANETSFFDLPPDGRVAVAEITRTGFDQNGQPFRITVTVFPADRNKFVINVGEVPGL